MNKRVFVSGCYDLLHSGHVEFFRQAAEYGDLYVGIGSDETYLGYKHRPTVYPEQERLFMVRSIRYVKEAYINAGSGVMDFVPTLDIVKPDVFVVNEDGACEEKAKVCRERGIEYVVLKRTPQEGLTARSSTDLKAATCEIPTRLDLAGTWIDQPYVSCHGAGWALTISLAPTFEIRERCGLSTSTRNIIKSIWPMKLPEMNPETLARLVFCFENNPEREDGFVSGAQDAIGICVPGLCRHYYNGHFWPEKIETCEDEATLTWLESHLCMIPLEPRKPGCSVVEGKDITPTKVKALTDAADACWEAIMRHDLAGFAAAYRASFNAQVAMFPGMVNPTIGQGSRVEGQGAKVESQGSKVESQGSKVESQGAKVESQGSKFESIQDYIDEWAAVPGVLAWKMPGAGGGGYLACVVEDAAQFAEEHKEAIRLTIRRR